MPNDDPKAAPRSCGAAFVSEAVAMDRAVRLGARSLVSARPNPPVGCVMLSESGHTVGEGRHIQPGKAHAEVIALEQAGQRANNGTLVVTLEPCNHHGRTPPCTERILNAGVRRVVYGTKDSNPVAEGGAIFLQNRGVEVAHMPHLGADRLNAPHLTWSRKSRPYVIAKWAQTQDGHMCPPPHQDRWITGIAARTEVHRLRGRVDAIVTGMGTVKADDCRLDPRLYHPRKIPLVAVASRNASIPREANIHKNRKVIQLSAPEPEQQLGKLAELGAQVVLLEAGPTLLHEYWQAQLVDEAWIFVGPASMPNASGKSPVGNPKELLNSRAQGSIASFGRDLLYRMQIAAI